ncbi:MAG: glycerol kinase GlpK, partial [Christensenellaceae bacterium]|nr:glycerol kinase GlpK [Christensenellaceae bacterium]
MSKYIIALDQGTTSSRAIVFDIGGSIVASHSIEFPQIFPQPGWVEHNPDDILNSQVHALKIAVQKAQIKVEDILAIGITNQRETTLVWDKETGECVCNAIVWQCRRTAPYIEKLEQQGLKKHIIDSTGLIPDAYFSGTKIAYILDNYQLYDKAKNGKLCFGTVDSFLTWNMVEGRPHVTDATNASRTMLFDIKKLDWDSTILNALNIPKEILPKVVDTSSIIGMLKSEYLGKPIPVASLVGDQHAALFGQMCFEKGMVKNTYGTGCFMLMNTGNEIIKSNNGLISTLAWKINGKPTYAIEGSVFMGGATVKWLRDELKLINHSSESEIYAKSVESTNGVYLVPAFTGLGAPHWDMYSRGTIVGMTRGTNRAHIVRAALEAICYQSNDLLKAMEADSKIDTYKMRVDGGASENSFLMQFQADISNINIERPNLFETTAFGAALLAGLS